MKRAIASGNILINHTVKSVLERQDDRLKYHNQLDDTNLDQPGYDTNVAAIFSEPIVGSISPNPGLENGWPGFGFVSKETPTIFSDIRSGNFKKRKPENVKWFGALTEKDGNEKKKIVRGLEEDEEEKSKVTEENIGSIKSIRKKTKVTKEQQNSSTDSSKSDYIHVRARRGQATDSHSLAERVRREKISERMKFLQDLVPGCNKIIGKAGMLDEIINYVQSLQSQIEFLSMKLAAVDFETVDNIFGKEVIPVQTTSFTNVVMPSHDMVNSDYLQFNTMQQVVQSSGMEATISDQMWDSEMKNLYSSLGLDQGLSQLPTFTNSQAFSSGSRNTNNLRVKM